MAGKALRHKLEAMALKAALGLFGALPLERASAFGAFIAGTLGPRLGVTNRARANMARAMPELAPAEREAIIKKMWRNLGRTIGEYSHLHEFQLPAHRDKLGLSGTENLSIMEERDKGAIFISGHFANWEIMAAVICRRPVDCLVTYRALNNPHIDRRINKVRHDYGIGVLAPKGLGTRELMRALSAGRSVALMNAQKFNQGLGVPFFGHEAMTAPGPARLAVKYDVPLIPVSTVRTGPARFRVTIHDAIRPAEGLAGEDAVRDCVEKITAFIEAEIRANPGQWFWQHRRWPKSAWKDAGV